MPVSSPLRSCLATQPTPRMENGKVPQRFLTSLTRRKTTTKWRMNSAVKHLSLSPRQRDGWPRSTHLPQRNVNYAVLVHTPKTKSPPKGHLINPYDLFIVLPLANCRLFFQSMCDIPHPPTSSKPSKGGFVRSVCSSTLGARASQLTNMLPIPFQPPRH
jgi:hypothetical protein